MDKGVQMVSPKQNRKLLPQVMWGVLCQEFLSHCLALARAQVEK
jgi:hypothetical protein